MLSKHVPISKSSHRNEVTIKCILNCGARNLENSKLRKAFSIQIAKGNVKRGANVESEILVW